MRGMKSYGKNQSYHLNALMLKPVLKVRVLALSMQPFDTMLVPVVSHGNIPKMLIKWKHGIFFEFGYIVKAVLKMSIPY